ncbi:hypothetical protein PFICI_02973 [Pestalotiopsis fici W106-1]|uniref:Myb-like domain-containing protein n=1 Tax=Pestalotiopsis fici (strain W106-1 / CGMCC3.15140) TaxID=1229662 RepID=W3XFR8_PESFW|nr:uncharacterized protein PFICI_02973 [Pestalotiopsis fici W106-1]ETS84948.1 hypothetical protein PFICI_02973 [Pestalotiopsis fici W106-1]
MSEATTPDPKANSPWSPEDVSTLLFTIMTQSNDDLLIKGWNDIGQKLQAIWGDKYSLAAAKFRFQKMRLAYLEKTKNNDVTSSDNAVDPAKATTKAVTPRKRTAKSKGADTEQGNQDEAGETPKKKRGRKPKTALPQETPEQCDADVAMDEA